MNTVIGLKRKAPVNSDNEAPPHKKKFLDLSLKDQSLTIVRWLTNKESHQIVSRKTARHEVIEDPTMFVGIQMNNTLFSLHAIKTCSVKWLDKLSPIKTTLLSPLLSFFFLTNGINMLMTQSVNITE